MMKIVFDIDGVLADILPMFIDFLYERIGIRLKLEEIDSYYDWHRKLGIEKEAFSKLILEYYESPHLKRAVPMEEMAFDVIKSLAKNHDVLVLTSRHELTRQATEEFMEKYYPGVFNEILFTNNAHEGHDAASSSKAKLLSFIGADFVVDDDPDVMADGCKLLLYDSHYNKDAEDNGRRVRFKSFEELPHIIEEVEK